MGSSGALRVGHYVAPKAPPALAMDVPRPSALRGVHGAGSEGNSRGRDLVTTCVLLEVL